MKKDISQEITHEHILNKSKSLLDKLDPIPDNFISALLPDGGMRFEWSSSEADFIAEFEIDGGIYLCSLGENSADDLDYESPIMDDSVFLNFVRTGLIIPSRQ